MNEVPDAGKIQALKIITLAMMTGATAFLFVCGFIIFTSTGAPPANDGSFLTFAVLVGATWVVSQMLKLQIEVLFKRKLAGDDPFSAYQSLVIIRMALSEGPALFGLVGLFIFGRGSDPLSSPHLLIFLLPYLALMATGLKNMPSENDFKDRVRVAKENKSVTRR